MSASPEYSRAPLRLLLQPVAAVPDDDQHEMLITTSTEGSECTTPTSAEFRLPVVPPSCPQAPRKPLRAIRCKRRLSELEFLVVPQEELESLFTRRGCSGRADFETLDGRQISAKKRKVIITE